MALSALALARKASLLLTEAEAALDAMELAEAETGVTVAEILGPDRLRRTARARQMAMYFAARRAGLSLRQISRAFGRTFSTVAFNVRAEAQRRGEVTQ